MNKITLLLLFITTTIYCQEIVKNETDDFTGKSIKETSWISLQRSNDYSYTRFRKIDNTYTFDYKLMYNGQVFSVDKGDKLMFKFLNNEIMELENNEYAITGIGNGATGLIGSSAMGIYLHFMVDESQIKKIADNTIQKVRLYTTDGYIEGEIKEKLYKKFKKQAELILQ